MKFPTDRSAQYEVCAYILADTAREIGGVVSSSTADGWASTMSRLAIADEISEVSPEAFSAPESLVGYLGLDNSNQQLVNSASRLLDANVASMGAVSIREHFQARRREAEGSIDLLRFQSPVELMRHEYVWSQLGAIATVGIHIDSIIDAQEDAHKTPFSTKDLILGAVADIARVAPRIDPKTWVSVYRASHRQGLDSRIVTKTLRNLKSALKNKKK